MTAHDQWKNTTTDPLGLGRLETIEPGYDGWDEIGSALRSHHEYRLNRRRAIGWLAIAASLVLVVSVTLRSSDNHLPADTKEPGFATPAAELASVPVEDNLNALISLSQSMEEQLLTLRQETSSMPAESAIYVVELEDLIAQVDNQLSLTPDSINLWGQRVNLMLDLSRIYQQHWQIDYGRMASL